MLIATILHFLVANGLIRYFIGWCVGFFMNSVLVVFVRRAWHDHMKHQREIADLLRTDTPGGLGDLVLHFDPHSCNTKDHEGGAK